jgi:hypothetical protein
MRGYDAGYRRGRHEREHRGHPRRGYDQGYGRDYGPYDATGWMPFALAPLGWAPGLGWAGWGPGAGFVPPAPPPYGRDYAPRRVSPEQSPMYGRGGDRALRRWAERYGYDFEYTLRPRFGPRRY